MWCICGQIEAIGTCNELHLDITPRLRVLIFPTCGIIEDMGLHLPQYEC